ncbi:uncharacterized protein EDB91DRAFT_636266 [Suillus paluster]|uniref:uncharacterized protein n=1 Tax=Suillus paluster TaxID=48578 RepID=UPI001B86B944|nr:uncharacterized protein EDB91DRAFT_636266 [Suillus paluster]KAG1733650.1 hypothetical protein EDB91DRAFT_636266 [Suillus paluster]
MKSSLSQINADGSVKVTPKTPRILSGRYLHMLWAGSAAMDEDQSDEGDTSASDNSHTDDRSAVAETVKITSKSPDETPCNICAEDNSDIIIDEAEPTFQRSRSPVSSVTSGVSAALATLAKHCPPQLGWNSKIKTKRPHSSLEEEISPRIIRKRRQLIGWGHLQQEEVLLAWLTHALVPSDSLPSEVLAQDKSVAHDPCDSEIENTPSQVISHVSVKRRKTAHRISLTPIPEAEERWPYWLTRPLRTPWTFGSPLREDPPPRTSPPSHSPTPPIPAVRFSSAYASCFANAHRQPSVICWKLP